MSAEKLKKKVAKTGAKDLAEGKAKQRVHKKIELVEEPVVHIPMGTMDICVIGPGAIGGLVAAYLKDKRRKVFVVGTPEQVQAIRSNGLKVQGVRKTIFVDIEAKTQLDRKVDLVILAVKTQDITDVINSYGSFLKDTTILTTQNGVRAEKLITATLEQKDNIVSSIVMFGATYLEPGLITHNFEGDWVIGRPYGLNDDTVKQIIDEVAPAFNAVASDDIIAMKWTKLFINLNNCIPAMTGKSMQETFADVDMAKLSILLLKEAFAVVDSQNIKLVNMPNFELEKFRGLTQMPLAQAAQIFSGIMVNLSKEPLFGSVLQSIKRGRLSEIDFINGEFVLAGRLGSVGAPLNSQAVQLVHQAEKTNKFFTAEQIKQAFRLDERG